MHLKIPAWGSGVRRTLGVPWLDSRLQAQNQNKTRSVGAEEKEGSAAKTLIAPLKDPDLISNTHMAARSHQPLQSQEIQCPLPSSLDTLVTQGTDMHTHKIKTNAVFQWIRALAG